MPELCRYHATGIAIDINTVQNPYIKHNILLPPNGKYDPMAARNIYTE